MDETFEYLFLAIYSFGLFLQEQVLGLVIEVQNEVLNEIFEDLNAEDDEYGDDGEFFDDEDVEDDNERLH